MPGMWECRLSRRGASLRRGVADRLDVVSVVIENESAVVVRVVVRAKARGPIILAAHRERCSVELIRGWPGRGVRVYNDGAIGYTRENR